MTDTDRILTIKQRINKLMKANAEAGFWGAAVAARHEEIKDLERELRRLTAMTDTLMARADLATPDTDTDALSALERLTPTGEHREKRNRLKEAMGKAIMDGDTEALDVAIDTALSSVSQPGSGELVECGYAGFRGTVVGSYITREGKHGKVVQQDGTKVVHVYRADRLKPVSQEDEYRDEAVAEIRGLADLDDLDAFGVAWSKDGKRIDPRDVYVQPSSDDEALARKVVQKWASEPTTAGDYSDADLADLTTAILSAIQQAKKPLEEELKATEEDAAKWQDEATYEVGAVPFLWSERAESAEAENKRLREALTDALAQVRYLHDKFGVTGSGEAILARGDAALQEENETV